MKKKLLYTSITIVVAVIGLFALQADWLIKTYITEKQSKANAADTALRRALVKFHQGWQDSVYKELYPQLKRIADTVEINSSPETNSLVIKLHPKILPVAEGMESHLSYTSRAFGTVWVEEATNTASSRSVGNIRVEYDYQWFSNGAPPDPQELLKKGPSAFLAVYNQDNIAPALEKLFGDPKGERAKVYFKTDSAKIIDLVTQELRTMGEPLLANKVRVRFVQGYGYSAIPVNKEVTTPFIYYRAQGLNGYYMGKGRAVAVFYPDLLGVVATKLLGYLILNSILMFMLIFSIVYLIKLILQQKQLAEMKDDFINNLTHEFKTPIATVSAAIEGLQKFNAINDKEKTERYLDISRTELNRLNDMVSKVLNISSYERKDLKLDKEKIDLEETVNEVTQMELVKGVKPVRFSVNISPDVKQLIGDPLHIKNVLGNLIDNAVKYSKNEVDISITAYRDKSTVAIKIKDNGIGIAAKDLKFIFDKFYRVTDGNLYNTKGNGLGLNYVRSIVEAHGGNITAKSEINTGTEFIITLPLNNG